MSEESTPRDLIAIGAAAEILGVSVKTLRRWEQKGLLKAYRLNGKDRFFARGDVENIKHSRPLSVSDVAERLDISPSTLRRLEEKGQVLPERDEHGRRLYTEQMIQELTRIMAEPYRAEVYQQITEQPVVAADQKVTPADVALPIRETHTPAYDHSILAAWISYNQNLALQNRLSLSRLALWQRSIFFSLAMIASFFALLFVIVTFYFFLFPEAAGAVFGFRSPSVVESGQVLGITSKTAPIPNLPQPQAIGTLLKPFGRAAVAILKNVDKEKYHRAVDREFIHDINEYFMVTEGNVLVPRTKILLPDVNQLVLPSGESLVNVNAQYLQGHEPGHESGNVVVLDDDGNLSFTGSITSPSVGTSAIKNGAVTAEKLAVGVLQSLGNVPGTTVTNEITKTVTQVIDLTDGAVTTVKLAEEAVTADKLLDGAVKTSKLADGAVLTEKLAGDAVTSAKISNNTITTDDLSTTLTFADGALVNLSAISHDDTGLQGLRLPNAASATPSSPASGEGYVAWDTAGNQLIVYDGSSWSTVTGGGGGGSGDVTAVGDCTTGACFAGASGTTLTFNDSDGDGTLTIADLSAARTWTLPNASGTFLLSGHTFTDDVTGTIDSDGSTALTIAVNSVALTTDTTGNYLASITAGTGLSGSAASEGATPTLSLSHLGLEGLADPNADRIFFWDDSAGASAWLSLGTNLAISGTTINATDTDTTYSAGTDLDLTGTTFSLETTLDSVDTINLFGAGTLNGLDVIDAIGEATLEATLDIAGDISGTGLGSVTIGADKVLESHLKAVNAATDEYCLTREETTGDFEWQSCATGSINSLTLAGTSGSNQTISDGDTITIAAGTGITTTGGATDTVTIASTLGTSIANSELDNDTIDFDKMADALALDVATSITGTAGETFTLVRSLTDATSENGIIMNFTAADTTAGTSAQYGLYLDNLASTEGLDASLVIDNSDIDDVVGVAIKLVDAGGGFTNVFDLAGTLISSTELGRLDGKDAALLDVNDAVAVAITGTGALNAGSITSGFGAIDLGADTITTTGTISTDTLTLTNVGTLNGLDSIDAVGEATLEATLDIAGDISGTGLASVTIGADKVLESHLKAVDAAVDEECLTYETTTGDFEWEGCDADFAVTLAGTSGSNQTISNGDTLTIAAGAGITTTGGATDTVTIASTLGTSIANSEVDNDTLDFDKMADALALDTATSITGTAGETFTLARSLTDATSENGVIMNFTAADTTAGTSAQYGLYIDNLASTEGLDASLVIDNSDTDDVVAVAIKLVDAGGGFTNVFDLAGTLISSTELGRLDGKDAALLDVNDAVAVAITGTGALNAGSITSGFGAVDVGADNITTTGIVSTDTLTLTNTGTLNGLDAIDSTTETTLEGALDIAGDVTGTGLGSVTIAANAVALTTDTTGNYVLSITNGSGITGGDGGSEGATLTLAATLGTSIANSELDNDTVDFDKMADALALDTATSITGTAGETFTLARSLTDATSENGVIMNFTAADTTSGTSAQYGLYLDNLASTEGLDASLVIDNSDTDDVVGVGIKFVDAGGGFTNILDLAGTLLSRTELGLLDGRSGTLVDSANVATYATTGVTAGTGLSGGGTVGVLALAIDSTVATLTGTQTLSNKTLASPTITGGLITVSGAATDVEIIDNSATALTISQGANNYLTLDTTDGAENLILSAGTAASTRHVRIGSTASSTTPDLFVLDKKSDAGNPSGVTGALFVSSSDKIMINEGGTWKELCNKTDAACGAGSGSAWSGLLVPAANLSLSHAEYTTAFTWDTAATAAAFDALTLSLTNDATTDTTAQRVLVLQNNDTTGSTATERLLVLNNADTDEAVTTAVEILASSTGTITTALDVSDAEIATALAIGANDITTAATTIASTELDRLDGKDAALVDTNDAVATAITGVGTITAGTWQGTTLAVGYGGTGATTFTTNGLLYGQGTSALAVSAAGTSGQLLVANASGVPTFVTLAGDATLAAAGTLTIAANAVALATDTTGDYVGTIAAGTGISTTGAATGEGIAHTLSATLGTSIANSELDNDTVDFDKLADALALDAATSITGTAGETFTLARSLTDATAENGIIMNFTAADTTAGTSAQYGLYLDNLASTEGLDASLVIDNSDIDDVVGVAIKLVDAGGGFTNVFDLAGTLISSAELGRLDGKDAALLDVNDAVAVAITGTGALNAGSITSGFGAIDLGVDTITTTGTISTDTVTLTNTGTLNGLDAIDATGEATLEAALDIAGDISGTGLTAVTIGADKVLESHLKSVNAATDEYCLTKEDTTGDFEWQSCATGSINSLTLAGTSGSNQTISDGDTITIAAGTGITTTGGATDTVTIASTLGTSIAAAEVDADTLDFTEFKDALTLDASTSVALGAAHQFTFDAAATDNTSTTGVLNLDIDTTTASNVGWDLDYEVLDDAVATAETMTAGRLVLNQYDVSGNTTRGLLIAKGAVTATGAGNTLDVGLLIDNADTDADGVGADTAETIVDAIRIAASGTGAITTGLDFDTTAIVTDIELQNGETIDNNTDGTITLTAPTVSTSSNLTVTGDLTITGDDLFMTTNTSGAILVADGTNFNPVVMGGDATIGTTGTLAIAANAVALSTDTTGNYVLSITNGSGITGGDGGSEGAVLTLSATLGTSIANSELDNDTVDFDKLADALALDAATSITGTAGETFTLARSLTDATAENGIIMNFTAADTTAGTSAQYGLYLDNLASTEGLDASLVIDNSDIDDVVGVAIKLVDAGGGFTNVFDLAGTLISSAELGRLDGKDAALLDVNDAVAVAITGTGALNAGSITSGFGAIDVGADNITTTGIVSTDTLTLTNTGTLNGLDAIDATGEATLEATLDIAGDISGTGLASVTIGADKVLESHLKAVNAATDEYCLTREETTGDFEWQSCATGSVNSLTLAGTSGSSQPITDGDTITIAAGTGITTTAGATDTVTIASTLGTSIAASEVDADSLDFTEFKDALALDAATSVTGSAGRVLSFVRTLTDATSENGLTVTVTAADTTSGTTAQYGLAISNAASTEGADALLALDNADADDSVEDAIRITSAAGTILTGLDFDDTDIVTDIEFQNGEALHNNTDGTIAFTDGTNNLLTIVDDGTSATVSFNTLTLTGTGTLNGLDAIDATGEATLEAALDIAGDVTGTGLGAVTVGKINGATLGVTTATAGQLLIGDGDSWESVAVGGDATLASNGTLAIAANAVALSTDTTGNYVLSITNGSGITGGDGGSEGAILTLAATLGTSIANSELDNDTVDFDKMADALALDTATSITGTAGETFTLARSLTDATSENGVIMNFTATDTTSGTSAQYGLYLDNIASTEGLDASLVIDNSDLDDAVGVAVKLVDAGGGFTNVFDLAGTLISSAELGRLDGKDAALLDVNDAVATAITGTGALNAGSITSGFGAIDVGADNITTTGTISTDTLTLTNTGTLNGLDAIDATGEATLEATLDIAGDVSGTGLSSVTIGADKVLESHLKAVDAASDEECLTYESTTGDFEWEACTETGATLFTLAGSAGDNQAITAGDTVTLAAGAGITTTGGATDTVTIAATLGTSIANSELDNDTVDFDKLADALTLDADTSISMGAGTRMAFAASAAPTLDLVTISNSGFGTVTNGVDGLFVTLEQADDGAVDTNTGLNLTVTGSGDTDAADTMRGINISSAGIAGGTLYGLNIAGVTGGAGTEYAIVVGTGWDRGLDISSPVVITSTLAQTSTATTGNATSVTASALTTGNGLDISNTSTAATSSDLIQGDHTATYVDTATVSGQLLDLTRALTINDAADTLTVSGALASLSDNCTATAGTCTHSGDVLRLTQDYATASGAVVNIDNGGAGYGLRVNDDGTATDSTPFVVDATGNVGIGTTAPGSALDVGSGTVQTTGSVLANTLDRTTSGALTIGNTTATSVSICNSAACDTIQIGSNADADTLTVGDALDSFTLSSTAFSVTSAGAVSGITTIGASDTLTIGSGGNTFTFNPASGAVYAGTARPTRKVTLSPEFPGATLSGDGGSNSGTLTSDFCENGVSADLPQTNTGVCNTVGDIHNYYSWTTSQGTAQDYDVWLRYRVPDNFAAWAASNPVQVYGKRTDATNNAVTVYVYDTAGTLENTSGTQVAGTTWTQTSVEASFGGTYTAGSYMTIRIVVTADTGGDSVQVGEISLDYLSNN